MAISNGVTRVENLDEYSRCVSCFLAVVDGNNILEPYLCYGGHQLGLHYASS